VTMGSCFAIAVSFTPFLHHNKPGLAAYK